MYFSNHNEAITFSYTYGRPLKVEGKGAVCRDDLDVFPTAEQDWPAEYSAIHLTKGITEAKAGFLDAFTGMETLILDRTVRRIAMTPALAKLLRQNLVLIRGEYDTYAEEFAQNNKLNFLHADIFLALDRDEKHFENTFITLRFYENGKAAIECDVYSPGSSAGNNGGGTIANEIPGDFYVGCTVEKFADHFPAHLRDKLLKNEELKRFLKTANMRRNEGL